MISPLYSSVGTPYKDVPMRISVIISTYNSPEWLEKVLWGYAAQTDHNFEILIADDGSHDATRRRIDLLRSPTQLTIQHVWHEDRGFRKCTILNRAIDAATGDYLIFSDGDCIPRADFIATHRRLAQPGRFLSGGYFKLPMNISQSIQRQDILEQRCFQHAWLRKHGLPWSLKNLKILAPETIAKLLDAITTTRASWNGHNASGWKHDLLGVNGFDERMEYGGEDRELGDRLQHAGIKGICIRHRAVVVHLEHDRGYVNAPALARNRQIWNATRSSRLTWTEHGILQPSQSS
jgi:GT2 family glycosyltransferase